MMTMMMVMLMMLKRWPNKALAMTANGHSDQVLPKHAFSIMMILMMMMVYLTECSWQKTKEKPPEKFKKKY